jgi:inorganic pyrophosphatase
MGNLLDTLIAVDSSGLINVVIDTPSGSAAKYKYDAKLGCYRVSRLLPKGAVFPYSFGSIPRTAAEDGDPLDVLVLCDASLAIGILVTVKLIGILWAEQIEGGKALRNNRLLGVPVTEVNRAAVADIDQINDTQLREIEHFFYSYNHAHGRPFKSLGRGGATEAQAALHAAQQRYDQDHQ